MTICAPSGSVVQQTHIKNERTLYETREESPVERRQLDAEGFSGIDPENEEAFEEVLEEVEELQETTETEQSQVPQQKADEPSRKHLNRLKAVTIRLLHRMDKVPSDEEITNAFKGNDKPNAKEIGVVSLICEVLLPYMPSADDSMASRIPLVMFADSILRAGGYSYRTLDICPQISPATINALHLDAAAIYEVFSGQQAEFSLFLQDNKQITSY